MKKKKSSRAVPVMREGRAGRAAKTAEKGVPEIKQSQTDQKNNPPTDQPIIPDLHTTQTQTQETENPAVLPPLPSTSAQLVTVPSMPVKSGATFSFSSAAITVFLLFSLGANVLLWKQYKGIAGAMNALSAQYSACLPVELSVAALNNNLQAYNGKRIKINALALLANHPGSCKLAAGLADPKGPSIDVYYENAINSPSIRSLNPAATKTVSITGTFNRYENENTWYIEAESIQ
jgi:hypothetical protein